MVYMYIRCHYPIATKVCLWALITHWFTHALLCYTLLLRDSYLASYSCLAIRSLYIASLALHV